MIFDFRLRYQKAKVSQRLTTRWVALYQKYERILIPSMLVFGFVADYITFKNIQITTALSVLSFYFMLAGATIAFIHYYDIGLVSQRFRFVRLFAPLVVQFTFGALLGAVFIFYWFSASLVASWPFVFIIILFMISNEFLKRYFTKPIIHISVYYFIAFSFFSIILPYVFNSLDARLFLAAGILSSMLIYAYVRFLSFAQSKIHEQRKTLAYIILAIFTIMNALYFSNIIPPIPLSLREAGVYHGVSRLGSEYVLERDKESFWQKIIPGTVINVIAGQRVFVYTAIFAPSKLNTRIYHHWEYYDGDDWIEKDKLSFNIIGGRKDGYRGYSVKSAVEAGKWRVYVKTEQGKVLGRVSFKIKKPAK